MSRELWKGNYAMAEAAVRAGLEGYFGYPITPQTEVLEYLASRLPEVGGVFVQAESEVAAINMIYGAACTGARVMTTSSGPGVSLMMEGFSYIAGSEVPMVFANVMRGGPGLGNIAPSQSDYNQMVHGGGHGDYRPIVLAPSSVQETIDLTIDAFDLAHTYRTIAVILTDGAIGQMMEPAEMPALRERNEDRSDWAVGRRRGGEKRTLNSFDLDPYGLEQANMRRLNRWQSIEENEVRFKEYQVEDADVLVVAFGTAGRIVLSAIQSARKKGIRAGLLRPLSLSPFPSVRLRELARKASVVLVVEMNAGQMLFDVQKVCGDSVPVEFHGRVGGVVPYPEEILREISRVASAKIVGPNSEAWGRWLGRMNEAEGVSVEHFIGRTVLHPPYKGLP